MGYGWLIMLLVIGAVNIVGRIAAKRTEMAAQRPRPVPPPDPAASRSTSQLPPVGDSGRPAQFRFPSWEELTGETGAAPTPPVVPASPPKPKVVRAPKPAAAPTAARPATRRVEPARPASVPKAPGTVPAPKASAIVPPATASKASAAAQPARKAPSRASVAQARASAKRWTGKRLREAFVASEILGAPRSIRPLGGSAHEAR